jgi:hypothetical protein
MPTQRLDLSNERKTKACSCLTFELTTFSRDSLAIMIPPCSSMMEHECHAFKYPSIYLKY